MTADEPTMERRGFMGSLASLPLVSWGPIAKSGAEKLSALSLEPEVSDAILYEDTPSWIVHVEEFETDAATIRDSWVQDDGRELLDELPSVGAVVVKAPRNDVGALTGWLSRAGGGLAGKGYVTGIDLNFTAGLPEPVKRFELGADDGADLDQSTSGTLGVVMDYLGEGSSPTTLSSEPMLATGETTEVRPVGDAHRTHDAASIAAAAGGSADTSDLLIGVIDTGCNVDRNAITEDRIHPDSTNYVDDDRPTVGEDGVDVVEDGNNHGSWCSSAIGAAPDTIPDAAVGDEIADYRGLLPNADLWIGKALDDNGGGATADIAAAIDGAVAANCDWVCMSLGSPTDSTALAEAIQTAVDKGTGVVVAAGNSRFSTTWVTTPASDDAALGVHATTASPDDPESVLPAYFANVGPHPGTTDLSGGSSAGATPTLAAPGMDLEVVLPRTDGSTGLSTMSGTSMAAPALVGVAGLVQAGTELTDPREIRTRLTETARRPPGLADVEGDGIASANRAIDGETTEESQSDAMNSGASARAAYYQSLSVWQGRLAFDFF